MKPLIFGLAGPTLSNEEREFFLEQQPHGFILFSRNCENREQIIALTTSLKDLVPNTRILIDQEGGRVSRLKPPILSKEYPSASYLASKWDTIREVFNNYQEMMQELIALGIDTNCAPVVDLFFEGSSDIIGDRSFGSDPKRVASLSETTLNGIEVGGGIGVIKHIPGHGRATCDSHFQLPTVTSSLEELEETDFAAFRILAKNTDVRYAMTAHIVYEALDPKNPATLSKIVIDYIRNNIGFTGKIMTDDISMKALSGSLSEITTKALSAGCNLILHCNGKMEEMQETADAYDKYAGLSGKHNA